MTQLARTGVLLGLALLIGCAGNRPKIKSTYALKDELAISAVAIQPVGLRWEEPAFRSLELAQRMVQHSLAQVGTRVLVFGSYEVNGYGATAKSPWAPSQVVSMLPEYGLAATQLVIFRPWVERRVISGQTEVLDKKGQNAGKGLSEQITYVAHLEMLHPASGTQVGEVSAELFSDPLAVQPVEGDPSPDLTRLVEALTAEALQGLAQHLRPPRAPRPFPLKLAFNPVITYPYAENGRPAFQTLLESLDPLDAELARKTRIHFLNSALADETAGKLASLPGGLLVIESRQGYDLRVGDLVLEVDGKPATPQLLQRKLFGEAPPAMMVQRTDGSTAYVFLP